MGNEQRFGVESNLIQAFIHLIKLVALPEDHAVRHWTKETNAFLANAARRWRPSMRRAFDHDSSGPTPAGRRRETSRSTATPCRPCRGVPLRPGGTGGRRGRPQGLGRAARRGRRGARQDRRRLEPAPGAIGPARRSPLQASPSASSTAVPRATWWWGSPRTSGRPHGGRRRNRGGPPAPRGAGLRAGAGGAGSGPSPPPASRPLRPRLQHHVERRLRRHPHAPEAARARHRLQPRRPGLRAERRAHLLRHGRRRADPLASRGPSTHEYVFRRVQAVLDRLRDGTLRLAPPGFLRAACRLLGAAAGRRSIPRCLAPP